MLEDVVGLLEALRHVPVRIAELIADVRAFEFFRRLVVITVQLAAFGERFVNDRRARLERAFEIVDRRQLVVLDFDQSESLFRRFGVDGRDARDGIADEPDFIGRDDRLVLVGGAVIIVERRQIVARDDGKDPRQLRGLRRVDSHELRVRIRAAENFAHRHVGQFEIDRISRLACGLVLAVDALEPLADDFEAVRSVHISVVPRILF